MIITCRVKESISKEERIACRVKESISKEEPNVPNDLMPDGDHLSED
jgi:hypothetical protein